MKAWLAGHNNFGFGSGQQRWREKNSGGMETKGAAMVKAEGEPNKTEFVFDG